MKRVMVSVPKLYVREEAKMSSEPIGVVSLGDVFEVFQEENNFYKIEKGWIVKIYTREMKSEQPRKRARKEVKE